MAKRLVVNADDLGLHPSVDQGIWETYLQGILTSASVLTTGQSAPAAVARWLSSPASPGKKPLGLGVHLCASDQLPCAAPPEEVPHLAPGGRFRLRWRDTLSAFAWGGIPRREFEAEWRAQIRKLQQLGAEPDHLDSHQHLHHFPRLFSLAQTLASELAVPLRKAREWTSVKSALLSALALGRSRQLVPSAGISDSGQLTEAACLRLLEQSPDGSELFAHPGIGAADRDTASPYPVNWSYGWDTDRNTLCSDRVAQSVQQLGIQLVTFAELKG